MKVEEILDILDNLAEDEREYVLRPLMRAFSRVSLIALKELQDQSKSFNVAYDEFVQKQNDLIRKCVAMEIGELGKMLRGESGYEDLTMETDVS